MSVQTCTEHRKSALLHLIVTPHLGTYGVTEADLDARVTRSLGLLMGAGLFDPVGSQTYTKIPFATINSAAAQLRNLEAARQSLVLLKNPPRRGLPLARGKAVALIGPHARTTQELAGNYFEEIGVGSCAGPRCILTMEAAVQVWDGLGSGGVGTRNPEQWGASGGP